MYPKQNKSKITFQVKFKIKFFNSLHKVVTLYIPNTFQSREGGFSKVVATFNHGGESFIFSSHHRECLNNPIVLNLGLCAACWTHFMCHHELGPTSVSHPFSILNNSLCLAGGKHYQKITIPVFRVDLQNFAVSGYFPYILFCRYILSLLSSGWFVIAVCGSVSVSELVK